MYCVQLVTLVTRRISRIVLILTWAANSCTFAWQSPKVTSIVPSKQIIQGFRLFQTINAICTKQTALRGYPKSRAVRYALRLYILHYYRLSFALVNVCTRFRGIKNPKVNHRLASSWGLVHYPWTAAQGMSIVPTGHYTLKGEHYSKTIFSTVKIYLITSILAVLFLHKSASFNRNKP